MTHSLRSVVLQIESSRIALDAALYAASSGPAADGHDRAAEVRMAYAVLRGWVERLRAMAADLAGELPPEEVAPAKEAGFISPSKHG